MWGGGGDYYINTTSNSHFFSWDPTVRTVLKSLWFSIPASNFAPIPSAVSQPFLKTAPGTSQGFAWEMKHFSWGDPTRSRGELQRSPSARPKYNSLSPGRLWRFSTTKSTLPTGISHPSPKRSPSLRTEYPRPSPSRVWWINIMKGTPDWDF